MQVAQLLGIPRGYEGLWVVRLVGDDSMYDITEPAVML